MNRSETIASPLAALGRYAIDLVRVMGSIMIFFVKGFALIFSQPTILSKTAQQVYFIGSKSIFVICLTGAFTGMVLGLKTDNTYTEEKFTDVKSGQIYLALTDGLWETFNKDGDMFGMQRVHELIRSYAHLSAAEISAKITEDVTRFRGKKRPEDDLTFVIVKVL